MVVCLNGDDGGTAVPSVIISAIHITDVCIHCMFCKTYRDLRLMRAVRSEVEKCAVVRSLVKQRDHMQQLLSNREAELDTLKRTQVRPRRRYVRT